jgi:hypothetical protein
MAVTTTILKKTRHQVIVKFVGDGQGNLTHLDAKLPEETLDLGNISMPITQLAWSSSDASFGPIYIKRPYTAVANTHILHSADNWSLAQAYGISDTSNASSIINVMMPAGGATMYLTISKPGGFASPDLQANTLLR